MKRFVSHAVLAVGVLMANPAYSADRFFCVSNDDVRSSYTAAVQVRFCTRSSYDCGTWKKHSIPKGQTFVFQAFNPDPKFVEIETQSGGLTNNQPTAARTSRRAAYYNGSNLLSDAIYNKGALCRQGKVRFSGSYFVDGSNSC